MQLVAVDFLRCRELTNTALNLKHVGVASVAPPVATAHIFVVHD
jgi:hypothetical protein